MHLLEITKIEAHKKLFEGNYELAIPAALQALRFSMEVYGHDSIQLVPSYLLLGESSIGLKQYKQAEDYLSLAKWAVLKVESACHPTIRAQLHRNLGMLYSSKGNYEDALQELAHDVIHLFSLLDLLFQCVHTPRPYKHIRRIFSAWKRVSKAKQNRGRGSRL